jgi:hypothetical protein
MKLINIFDITILKRFGFVLALFFFASMPVQACTIFVITDNQRILFCNNEDWSNPKTRIWFVSSKKHYGCVYVGFDNGWAQGGLNTKGLAFDWVAGFKEKWDWDPKKKTMKEYPSELMLKTCATIEDAIAFFKKYWEPSFSYAKILIADSTGASVIIGAKDGCLNIEVMKQSRGFGYGGRVVDKMLEENHKPTLDNAAKILRAAIQDGQYATKYSNVFDLKSGDIFLFRFPNQENAVKLNLYEELKKGDHFYDIPEIDKQLTQKTKPLLKNMKHK